MEDAVEQLCNDDPAEEIGQVQATLNNPLVEPASNLVQKKGEKDGYGKTEDNAIKPDQKGIDEYPVEVGIGEHDSEVLPADPGTPPYSLEDAVIFPGDKAPGDGCKAEHHEEYQPGQYHDVEPGTAQDVPPKRSSVLTNVPWHVPSRVSSTETEISILPWILDLVN